MNDMPETMLIALAADGDSAAFEKIMRRYNQLVYRSARSIIGEDADAEEVVQDAWMRAWRGLKTFRQDSRLSTWLVRIVRNEALGRLRRKSIDMVELEEAVTSSDQLGESSDNFADNSHNDPERRLISDHARRELEAEIDRLPEAFRTVFMLRAVDEMDVDDVASVLDIPKATVRTRYFRARNMLRERLGVNAESAYGEAFAFNGARCDRMVAGVLARGKVEGLAHSMRTS